jgi:hypothetical protein
MDVDCERFSSREVAYSVHKAGEDSFPQMSDGHQKSDWISRLGPGQLLQADLPSADLRNFNQSETTILL